MSPKPFRPAQALLDKAKPEFLKIIWPKVRNISSRTDNAGKDLDNPPAILKPSGPDFPGINLPLLMSQIMVADVLDRHNIRG